MTPLGTFEGVNATRRAALARATAGTSRPVLLAIAGVTWSAALLLLVQALAGANT